MTFDCVFVSFLRPGCTAIERRAKLFHRKRGHCSPDLTDGSDGKQHVCNVEDLGSIPGLGRHPGEGNGLPLFLPGEFHGQSNLGPGGLQSISCKELDTAEC